jgi:hypothetical protein
MRSREKMAQSRLHSLDVAAQRTWDGKQKKVSQFGG